MALPLIIGGVVAAVAPIIGDLIGRALSAGDREAAQRYMDQAVAQYGPDILKAPSIAELTPHLGRPAMADVYADPQDVANQREAVAELRRLSQPDNLSFRAAANEAESFANQQAGGQQAAIQQQMQTRGLGGSGVDFALRQQAGQDAANRAAQMGFNARMEGQRQAREALRDFGQLSTTMRGMGFNEGAQRAGALDQVARINEAGRVAGAQQDFQNRMGLAGARANIGMQAANVKQGNAAQTQQQWGNYGQGVGQGAGAVATFLNDEEWRKSGGRPGGR